MDNDAPYDRDRNRQLKDWRQDLRYSLCQIFKNIGRDIDDIYSDPQYRDEEQRRSRQRINIIGSDRSYTIPYRALDPEAPNLKDKYAAALAVCADDNQLVNHVDTIFQQWSGGAVMSRDELYNSDDPDINADLKRALAKVAQRLQRFKDGLADQTPRAETEKPSNFSRSPYKVKLANMEVLLSYMHDAIKTEVRHNYYKDEDNKPSPWAD